MESNQSSSLIITLVVVVVVISIISVIDLTRDESMIYNFIHKEEKEREKEEK
jgi:hypothetical protein